MCTSIENQYVIVQQSSMNCTYQVCIAVRVRMMYILSFAHVHKGLHRRPPAAQMSDHNSVCMTAAQSPLNSNYLSLKLQMSVQCKFCPKGRHRPSTHNTKPCPRRQCAVCADCICVNTSSIHVCCGVIHQ